MTPLTDREGDRRVLTLIGGGIIAIILCVIAAMSFGKNMPDWSESVMSAIVGGTLVKLADVLSALVTLSGSRQTEKLTDQLSQAAPISAGPKGTPEDPLSVTEAEQP